MTSSSETRVLRADEAGSAYTPRTPDLRAGTWTRLGSGAALGDVATEDTLSSLAERTRATAEAQGYAVGWAKGVREAQAAEQQAIAERTERAERERTQRLAEHAAAVAALREAANGLDVARSELCRRLSEQAAGLAVAVTAEVLGQRADEQTPANGNGAAPAVSAPTARALHCCLRGDTRVAPRAAPSAPSVPHRASARSASAPSLRRAHRSRLHPAC